MTKNIVFWIGIVLVAATHIYMLTAGLPESQMTAHAVINLVAAGMIVYSKV